MPDLYTMTGTRVAIGPAVTDVTDTAAEFAALTPWVEIGLIENVGDIGDEAASVTGNVINESRTRKAKGVRDAGSMTITCFDAPTDAGQLALVAAEATNNNYAFRLTAPNKITSGGTDGIEYLRGLVMSKRKSGGGSDALRRRTFNIGINSPIVEVAPT